MLNIIQFEYFYHHEKYSWAVILHVPGLQCVNPLLRLLIVHMDLRRVPSGQKPGAVWINGNIQCLSNFIDCMKALPWRVMPKFDQTWGIWNLKHNLPIYLIICANFFLFWLMLIYNTFTQRANKWKHKVINLSIDIRVLWWSVFNND